MGPHSDEDDLGRPGNDEWLTLVFNYHYQLPNQFASLLHLILSCFGTILSNSCLTVIHYEIGKLRFAYFISGICPSGFDFKAMKTSTPCIKWSTLSEYEPIILVKATALTAELINHGDVEIKKRNLRHHRQLLVYSGLWFKRRGYTNEPWSLNTVCEKEVNRAMTR